MVVTGSGARFPNPGKGDNMVQSAGSTSQEDGEDGPQGIKSLQHPELSSQTTKYYRLHGHQHASHHIASQDSLDRPCIHSEDSCCSNHGLELDLELKSRPSSLSAPGSSDAPLPNTNSAATALQCSRSPEKITLLESPTQNKTKLALEWTFYPRFGLHTYHIGKRCVFNGSFLRNKTSASERTLEMCLGRKKHEIDCRNGIPMATPCDNCYKCPEHSLDFHRFGSTRPVVNFGCEKYKKRVDTFIPLQHLPQIPCVPYHVKEKQKELARERNEVKNLDRWKPAPPLCQTLLIPSPLRRIKTS
ncbi:PREDICTED: spermatogenesis-associated serine-rich protein 1 [Gavialis gangeticus]|uniref:spermatogenesis-associated serine-rich protein 1 n=1 Tax=Gavialis gangeticus TaxID=94835 RepID=UPI00092E75D9|nr:PREDICTED: spermatogenesis-associated serine-rich protein 1 [Gavialis gangeticus]